MELPPEQKQQMEMLKTAFLESKFIGGYLQFEPLVTYHLKPT